MNLPVIASCTEEVRRQGHDVATLDGIERVGWMLNAWSYALARQEFPNRVDAIRLGMKVEPEKNIGGLRTCRVRVGSRVCPEPDDVPDLLVRLFAQRDSITPLEFYKQFELIHPFRDGNGRAGKILMAWLSGALLAPIFPPHDLFGGWIENP